MTFTDVCTAEIGIVRASDVAPAVVVKQHTINGVETHTFMGYEGALWRPLQDPFRPYPAELLIRQLENGAEKFGFSDNPFYKLGRRPYNGKQIIEGSADDYLFDAIENDDRAEKRACATRLAADLLIVEGGPILRKTPGPLWSNGFYGFGLRPSASYDFALPHSEESFGILRHDEAVEFLGRHGNYRINPERCELEIFDSSHIADNDAIMAARAVANFAVVKCIFEHVDIHVEHGMDEHSLHFLTDISNIYGRETRVLKTGHPLVLACPGIKPPDPSALNNAVEGVMSFFENPPLKKETIAANRYHLKYLREELRPAIDRAYERWTIYEKPRLEEVLPPPDLTGLSTSGPRP